MQETYQKVTGALCAGTHPGGGVTGQDAFNNMVIAGPKPAYCGGSGQLHQMSMLQVSNTLDCMHEQQMIIKETGEMDMDQKRRYVVRRLTPKECGRLQGFPDGWCDKVPHSDSSEYRLWGNGMTLTVMLYVINGCKRQLMKEVENH